NNVNTGSQSTYLSHLAFENLFRQNFSSQQSTNSNQQFYQSKISENNPFKTSGGNNSILNPSNLNQHNQLFNSKQIMHNSSSNEANMTLNSGQSTAFDSSFLNVNQAFPDLNGQSVDKWLAEKYPEVDLNGQTTQDYWCTINYYFNLFYYLINKNIVKNKKDV
ncbi:unnamed protein product, partial [Brachionus calyciflorus]